MSVNDASHPYAKFSSPGEQAPKKSNLNIESAGSFMNNINYYNVPYTANNECFYCHHERFKWCNIYWKCCCCQIRLCICMITFCIFLFSTLLFLLIIAYLSGFIFQSIPIKPSCCTNGIHCKSFNYNSWDKILKQIVKQTEYNVDNIHSTLIDYKLLYSNHTLNSMFNDFITEISVFDVSTLNCSSQFTFYINIYNAFAIKMVLDHSHNGNNFVNSVTDITEYFGLRSVWKMTVAQINGIDYTLNNIQQDILTKYWNDSRTHSALCCTALSCPDLINIAYKPYNIDTQLLSSFRLWMNNTSKGMKINENTLYVNKLYEWYQTDFKPNVKTFIITYVTDDNTIQSIQNAEHINYLSYNWNLNIYCIDVVLN